jgi:predicted deacylase
LTSRWPSCTPGIVSICVVIVARGKEEGPVLLLIGGVHGDETNGVAIVREVIRRTGTIDPNAVR